jgi:hypothetical protein
MLDFLSQQDKSNSYTPLPCVEGGGKRRDLSGEFRQYKVQRKPHCVVHNRIVEY